MATAQIRYKEGYKVMKDVISVDSIVFDIADTAERLGSRHPRLLEEAKTNLHSLLISKLPEKMVRSEIFEGESDGTIEAYNSAISDMYSTLNELFGVSNE